MKSFYLKATLFWLVLLVLAIFNATIREFTYKPWLEPVIGRWAHQVSSLTVILFFAIAIYFFIRKFGQQVSQKTLVITGLLWVVLTVVFETWMSIYIRQIGWAEILQSYAFWRGELWILVLVALLILPTLTHRFLNSRT